MDAVVLRATHLIAHLPLQDGFNRISQVCETHVAGGRFVVMRDAYLVHDGFKVNGRFHASKEREQAANRKLFRRFKAELKERYPHSDRRC